MRTSLPNLARTVAAAAAVLACCAAPDPSMPDGAAAGSTPESAAAPTAHDQRMAWWREARFGMFIHWGLYAIPAGEWNGNTDHGEWIMNTAQIPLQRYEQYREQFDPVQFDAVAWVRLAKRAGMKYVVITTKHHDGFCLFDSQHTDYDVMSTPFRRDIMKELADACRAEGLRIGWYHSIMDWHHPDYLPRREWEERPSAGADFGRYVQHLRNQVTELLRNYGPIGVMWFDGEWESTWSHAYGQPLYDLCRELQPEVIVNNRVDVSRSGMGGFSADAEAAGDFGTPEQEIPATGLAGVDWETCMTMNDHWGYNSHDQRFKPASELIRMLVDIASKGGNYLLNVGPTAEGLIPAASVERLEAIGRWMDANAESIHGTSASPIDAPAWGRCTMRREGARTKLYLHVFEWPSSGVLSIDGVGNPHQRAYLLAAPGRDLAIESLLGRTGIRVPRDAPDPVDAVVVLEFDGAPVVHRPPRIEVDSEIFVEENRVRIETGSDELKVRYTTDGSEPLVTSKRYDGPFTVANTMVIKARAFRRGEPVTAVARAQVTKVDPRPAVKVKDLASGLNCELFPGEFDQLPDFSKLRPAAIEAAASIALESEPAQEHIARRYVGLVEVPEPEVYVFALTSDDGSRLFIGNRLVVDNDGLHGAQEKRGKIALAKGWHPIAVEYFNKTGAAALEVKVGRIGERLATLAPARLGHLE